MIREEIAIALFSVPILDTRYPHSSIYQLKGYLNENNIKSKCFDLNKASEQHWKKYNNDINKSLHIDYNNDKHTDEIKKFYYDYVKTKVISLKPKWAGISIFSKDNIKSAQILQSILKKLIPNIKIVIGGSVLKYNSNDQYNIQADFQIIGDGEKALVELIKTNKQPPILNGDLNKYPIADYQDYYNDFGLKRIHIYTSKGCINNCFFCTIKDLFPKYRYRTADNIFKEIKYNIETYSIVTFIFTDSLINGNILEFKKFISLMKNYKRKIEWGGNFAIKNNAMNEQDFIDLYKAKMIWVGIGIESPIEHIRRDLGKIYNNKEMYFHIDNFLKNGIRCVINLMVGSITETNEDFLKSIDFLKHYSDFGKQGMIRLVISPLRILKASRLEKLTNLYINKYPNLEYSDFYWESKIVPNLDFNERYKRTNILIKKAKEMGYMVKHDKIINKKFKKIFNEYNRIKI